MATVKIGGRELEVVQANLGFRRRKLVPWRKRLAELDERLAALNEGHAKDQDADGLLDALEDMLVEGLLLFVGHNEGVTADWLLGVLPPRIADSHALLSACSVAAGIEAPKDGGAPGEAKSP